MVDFLITRPIFASVVAILMVLAGAVGYVLLPVAQFPDLTPPQVVVTSNYGGASAQTVADTVTTVLETTINGVEGMSYMSSVSANDGTSTITITFKVGYNIDIGTVDVQNRVSQASAQLPAGGSGAIGLADVAAGRLDTYVELHISLWDVAGALAILAETSASVSDHLSGDVANEGNPILAAAPGLVMALRTVVGM